MQHIPTKLDHEHEYIAGAVALDFANTIGGSRAQPTHDHVSRYADLVVFARGAHLLSEAQANSLISQAKDDPVSAMNVLSRAIALRDAIWAAFPTDRMNPKPRHIKILSDEASRAAAHMRLVSKGAGLIEWMPSDEVVLERVIWPIAQSAADLLVSDGRRATVRECESETCSWLFVDQTRNHSRRWCDMGDCGNRAKARRFRQRSKQMRAST